MLGMKDTIITSKRKKIELILFISCFVIANLINIYAIIHFGTPWSEMFTKIHITILIAIGLYVLLTILRIVVIMVTMPLKHNYRKKKRNTITLI